MLLWALTQIYFFWIYFYSFTCLSVIWCSCCGAKVPSIQLLAVCGTDYLPKLVSCKIMFYLFNPKKCINLNKCIVEQRLFYFILFYFSLVYLLVLFGWFLYFFIFWFVCFFFTPISWQKLSSPKRAHEHTLSKFVKELLYLLLWTCVLYLLLILLYLQHHFKCLINKRSHLIHHSLNK